LRALAAAPSIEPFRYTVHTGDSASKLAQRWGVPESLIVKPGHVLKVGEVVTIPIVARVKIARGQTLSAISHKYKISIESLAKFNRIPPPYRVRSGKVILVPALE
jgi:LysM repeat protein